MMKVIAKGDDPAYDGRPVPYPDELSREYFAAASRGELWYQQCESCGNRQFYPRLACTRCGAEPVWRAASGEGVVHTFTVVRQSASPPFNQLVPYVIAVIELEEGPRMMGNVTDCEPDEVHIRMPVTAYAVQMADDLAIPFWRPTEAET